MTLPKPFISPYRQVNFVERAPSDVNDDHNDALNGQAMRTWLEGNVQKVAESPPIKLFLQDQIQNWFRLELSDETMINTNDVVQDNALRSSRVVHAAHS